MKKIEKVILNTRNDYGKTIEIQCNKCGKWVLAYKWSISGGGKKCSCGNMLYRYMSTDTYLSNKTIEE